MSSNRLHGQVSSVTTFTALKGFYLLSQHEGFLQQAEQKMHKKKLFNMAEILYKDK